MRPFLSTLFTIALAGCSTFFDTDIDGVYPAAVDDGGIVDASDTSVADIDLPDGTFLCGEFQIRESPSVGDSCETPLDCAQGRCRMTHLRDGGLCRSLCSTTHCPDACGADETCVDLEQEEFSDGTPLGICVPRAENYRFCAFDAQCPDRSFCLLNPDFGDLLGWCIPHCEVTCDPFGDFEPFCTDLGETIPVDGCAIACQDFRNATDCPDGLTCFPMTARGEFPRVGVCIEGLD